MAHYRNLVVKYLTLKKLLGFFNNRAKFSFRHTMKKRTIGRKPQIWAKVTKPQTGRLFYSDWQFFLFYGDSKGGYYLFATTRRARGVIRVYAVISADENFFCH